MNASESASVVGTDFLFGEEFTIDAVWECGARGMGIKIEEMRALRADEVMRRRRTASGACQRYQHASVASYGQALGCRHTLLYLPTVAIAKQL